MLFMFKYKVYVGIINLILKKASNQIEMLCLIIIAENNLHSNYNEGC